MNYNRNRAGVLTVQVKRAHSRAPRAGGPERVPLQWFLVQDLDTKAEKRGGREHKECNEGAGQEGPSDGVHAWRGAGVAGVDRAV